MKTTVTSVATNLLDLQTGYQNRTVWISLPDETLMEARLKRLAKGHRITHVPVELIQELYDEFKKVWDEEPPEIIEVALCLDPINRLQEFHDQEVLHAFYDFCPAVYVSGEESQEILNNLIFKLINARKALKSRIKRVYDLQITKKYQEYSRELERFKKTGKEIAKIYFEDYDYAEDE